MERGCVGKREAMDNSRRCKKMKKPERKGKNQTKLYENRYWMSKEETLYKMRWEME